MAKVSGHYRTTRKGRRVFVSDHDRDVASRLPGGKLDNGNGQEAAAAAADAPAMDTDELGWPTNKAWVTSAPAGTEQGLQRMQEAVDGQYGPYDGISGPQRAIRMVEAARTNSDLSNVEDALARELFTRAGGQGTVTGELGPVQLSRGKPREQWDSEALTGFVAFQAQQERGPDETPEQAVMRTADTLLAAGGWKKDGLREHDINPHNYSTYTPTVDDNGVQIRELVPVAEEPSGESSQQFRSAITDHLKPDGKDTNAKLASKIVQVQRIRDRLRQHTTDHSRTVAATIEPGEQRAFSGAGVYEARGQGTTKQWQHDGLKQEAVQVLERTAPDLPDTAAGRYSAAASTLAQMRSPKGKKAAFGKLGMYPKGDASAETDLSESVCVLKAGRISAKALL